MKQIAKKILKALYRLLPWGAQAALNEAYFEQTGDPKILSNLANRYGIDSICVYGKYGLISGSPHDLVIMAAYAKSGFWSKGTNDLFIEFFEKKGGGTYLDIGANIGLTTIPIAKNPAVTSYCFEPEPGNYSNLKRNIRANCPHNNVTIYNIALFDKSSKLSFELSPINFGDHRIQLEKNLNSMNENKWQKIEIDAEPLDEIIENIDGVLAVKIDTQGAEPFVIAGGEKVLSKVDLLIVEFSPYWMARMGSNSQILIDYISTFQKIKISDPHSFEGNIISGDEAKKNLMNFVNPDKPVTGKYWDVIAWKE